MPDKQGGGHYPTTPPGDTGAGGARSGQSAQDIAQEYTGAEPGSAGSHDPTSPRFAPNG